MSAKNCNFREHAEIPLKIKKYKDHWYFSPHYVYPLFVSQSLLVTVHDLIHFRFPRLFKPSVRVEAGKYFMRQVRKKAVIVFAVSQATKNDSVEMFRFDEIRIRVIHNGIVDIFFDKEKQPKVLDFPYGLYTGNLKPHKNLGVLIDAFSLIKDRFPDIRLVLAGVVPDRAFTRELADAGFAERVVDKGMFEPGGVAPLHRRSGIFCFPLLI